MKTFFTLILVAVVIIFMFWHDVVGVHERQQAEPTNYKILNALRSKPLTIGQALDVADVIVEQCAASKISPSLILAVITVESEGFPYAVSSADAKGLMQLRQKTFNHYLGIMGIEGLSRHRFDPSLNVRVGILFLADLIKRFGLHGGLAYYFTGSAELTQQSRRYINKVLKAQEGELR